MDDACLKIASLIDKTPRPVPSPRLMQSKKNPKPPPFLSEMLRFESLLSEKKPQRLFRTLLAYEIASLMRVSMMCM